MALDVMCIEQGVYLVFGVGLIESSDSTPWIGGSGWNGLRYFLSILAFIAFFCGFSQHLRETTRRVDLPASFSSWHCALICIPFPSLSVYQGALQLHGPRVPRFYPRIRCSKRLARKNRR